MAVNFLDTKEVKAVVLEDGSKKFRFEAPRCQWEALDVLKGKPK